MIWTPRDERYINRERLSPSKANVAMMKICFVAPRFPYPITKGDTLRAYYQIRELSQNHSVHLIAAAEEPVSSDALAEMRKYCASIEVVRTRRVRSIATVAACGINSEFPLQVLYFDSPQLRAHVRSAVATGNFDIVHAMTIRVAPSVLATKNSPVVVDFMDSFAANVGTRRELVGPIMRRIYDIEYARVARYERSVAGSAAGGCVIAELDREAIGGTRLAIVPNGVDTGAMDFYDGSREAETVIFTGNMGYQPNIDAVTWFAAECWGRLREQRPNLQFLIVGARPSSAIVALGRLPGVQVTGRVDSMTPYLHRATVAVCPIRCGSGMQNKVLEAMATGVPLVTTSFANRSIGAMANRDVQVVESEAVAFANAVLKLLAEPELARAQAACARRLVVNEFSWSQRSTQLVALYKNAIAYHSRGDFKATG